MKTGIESFPPGMMDEIRAFLREDYQRPVGLDVYDDVFRTNTMFPLQRKKELARMIRTAREIGPRTVMEIGCDKGGGLYHWCKCFLSVQNVIGFEIRGTPYSEEFEKAFPHVRFQWGTDSQDVVQMRRLAQRSYGDLLPIDVLFIDGDKLKFKEDFDLYLPLMSPKGVVFMHDVADAEPSQAYEEVIARGYPYEVIHDVSESLEEMKKRTPPSCPHEAWLRHWRGRSCGVGVIRLDRKEKAS